MNAHVLYRVAEIMRVVATAARDIESIVSELADSARAQEIKKEVEE